MGPILAGRGNKYPTRLPIVSRDHGNETIFEIVGSGENICGIVRRAQTIFSYVPNFLQFYMI